MNKLFKLIYVNLLSLFDINKIIVAREDGVKSNLEKRLIITGIIFVFYGFLIFNFLKMINIEDKFIILDIGFIVSSIVCIITSLPIIEPIIFKNDDNDILFSLPVTRYQILFSKLFTIYLKNLIIVAILMISTFLSFYVSYKEITDTMVLMYVLSAFIVPLFPMILSTIIAYLNDYYKVKSNNSIVYKIIKTILILIFIFLLFLLFLKLDGNSINSMICSIVKRIYYVYPFSYLFNYSLVNENIFTFVLLIVLPIVFIYIYMIFITNNYLKICSMLKGVKKKEHFVYKKCLNLKKVFGIVRKELLNLYYNKFYFSSSFGLHIMLTSVLFFLLINLDIDKIMEVKNMELYVSLYLPTILAMFVTIKCSTISSMSLEKDNMQLLRTMPIGIFKVLLGKWLTNIIIGSIFVIINGTLVLYFLDTNGWQTFFNYFVPFISLLFVSFTGLLLDFRFIEKNETDDNSIINHRLINIIPTSISVFIGIGVFFLPIYNQYKYLLGGYCLVMVVAIIVEYLYILINKEKLLRGLFN